MTCFYPLQGWRAKTVGKSGKRPIVFDRKHGFEDMPVTLPCGRCIGCKLQKSREWAIRCMHESSLYEQNAYITLTYNNENLPPGGNLKKKITRTLLKDCVKTILTKYATTTRENMAAITAVLIITLFCLTIISMI